MMKLTSALQAWSDADFAAALKAEVEAAPGMLPLQQGLRYGAYVSEEQPVTTMLLSSADTGQYLVVKLGVMYSGIITGCSCADDPSPNNETNEYCTIELQINKRNAETQVRLLDE